MNNAAPTNTAETSQARQSPLLTNLTYSPPTSPRLSQSRAGDGAGVWSLGAEEAWLRSLAPPPRGALVRPAALARAAQGSASSGRRVASPPSSFAETRGMFPAQEEADRTVFVGNLEARVREEILYELFLQVPSVGKGRGARSWKRSRRGGRTGTSRSPAPAPPSSLPGLSWVPPAGAPGEPPAVKWHGVRAPLPLPGRDGARPWVRASRGSRARAVLRGKKQKAGGPVTASR